MDGRAWTRQREQATLRPVAGTEWTGWTGWMHEPPPPQDCRGGVSWDCAAPAGSATCGGGGQCRLGAPGGPTPRGPGVGRAAEAPREPPAAGSVAISRGHACIPSVVQLPTPPVARPAFWLTAQSLSCQFWRRRAGAELTDRRRDGMRGRGPQRRAPWRSLGPWRGWLSPLRPCSDNDAQTVTIGAGQKYTCLSITLPSD